MPVETYDSKMMVVGLDLSAATHGFVTSKVTQSYAVLDELAAATLYYDKYQHAPIARPDGAPPLPDADKGPRVCYHPRMENFDNTEHKGCVAVAANFDSETLGLILDGLPKSEYGSNGVTRGYSSLPLLYLHCTSETVHNLPLLLLGHRLVT